MLCRWMRSHVPGSVGTPLLEHIDGNVRLPAIAQQVDVIGLAVCDEGGVLLKEAGARIDDDSHGHTPSKGAAAGLCVRVQHAVQRAHHLRNPLLSALLWHVLAQLHQHVAHMAIAADEGQAAVGGARPAHNAHRRTKGLQQHHAIFWRRLPGCHMGRIQPRHLNIHKGQVAQHRGLVFQAQRVGHLVFHLAQQTSTECLQVVHQPLQRGRDVGVLGVHVPHKLLAQAAASSRGPAALA
mmetsp:Transcript_16006/g.43630  ORF Transcript_16006/g.43630 Transcript_16006/m.43630 type:complete len:238 (+) Transcript_16006:995-1708(+)